MTDAAEQSWPSLVLRPILLFVAGFAINVSLHELAHALAAYRLGVPSTLFHFYATIDVDNQPLLAQVAVRAAGPLFSLAFGLVCWFVHRLVRETWAELPLFYLAVFGIATFLGNLLSTSFAGDLRNAAHALELARWLRDTISVTGLVLLLAFSYDVGRELREALPQRIGGFVAMLTIVIVPTIIGTALLLAVYQPMSRTDMLVRLSEAAFWVVAALGAAVGSARPPRATRALRVRLGDWGVVLVAIAAVRVLALGIVFEPPPPAPPSAAPPPRFALPTQPEAAPVPPPGPARRPRSR